MPLFLEGYAVLSSVLLASLVPSVDLVPIPRTAARLVLGAFLVFAGVAHFRLTDSFLGQVPPWFPVRTLVVQVSGVVEILLGVLLLFARSHRAWVGVAVAALFVLVFPGNVSQLVTGADSFGLDSTASRVVRLLFQPLLIAWALWCTGAWSVLAGRWRSAHPSPKGS